MIFNFKIKGLKKLQTFLPCKFEKGGSQDSIINPPCQIECFLNLSDLSHIFIQPTERLWKREEKPKGESTILLLITFKWTN